MPFTLSHPAAVMPLRRLKSLPTLALIVGSMTPDVPYYFPARFTAALRLARWETHSLLGSVALCVPLGLVVLGCALLLRHALTALMTERARWVCLRAADRFMARPVHWLLAVPALIVGAWTHILWDLFTHPGTWLVRRIDALSAPVNLFGYYTGEVSHVLQYASSVLGLAVIAYWYTRVAAEAPAQVRSTGNAISRWLLLVAVVAAALLVGSVQAARVHHVSTVYSVTYLVLTRTLAWFLLLYTVVGAFVVHSTRSQPQLEI